MGMKAKKSMTKKVQKGYTEESACVRKDEAVDFFGGPARKLLITENSENKATMLYIGRIPHGFYENEMEEPGVPKRGDSNAVGNTVGTELS
ncbi:hypothetical protein LXL04_011300 [Taraxacum kok-saghyz]